MSTHRPPEPADDAQPEGAPSRNRWRLSPNAAAFVRERARLLHTDPETVLEDLVLVERRRVEGAL